MITRVTDNMKYMLLTNSLFNVQNKYNDLLGKMATQKQINRPSDDPIGTKNVMDYRGVKASVEQYQTNISDVESWLNITESTLSGVNDILTKIQEIALYQSSATASAATRAQAATALQPLMDQLLSLANTKFGDRYIFSGTRTDVKPFENEPGAFAGGAADAAEGNTYAGEATSGGTYTGTVNKAYVLNIVAGGDLDNATYRVSSDGGVTWGGVSGAGDMSSGDIDLGGGLTLHFEAGTFGAGDIFTVHAHVNGYYRGNGQELAVDIGNGTSFQYSVSGESAFTDEGSGDVDLFASLDALKTCLENDDAAGISGQLGNLTTAQEQVTRAQAQCGTRTNSLDVTKAHYDTLTQNIASLASDIEDAEITKLMTDFQMQEVALQACYSMAAQIGKSSILDFLK